MKRALIKLASAQSTIYLDQRLHPGSPLYNVGGYVVLRGWSEAAIIAAHTALMQREPVFRTRIVETDDGPMMAHDGPAPTALVYEDCRSEPDPLAAANRRIEAVFRRPLDAGGLLFRVLLAQTGEREFAYAGLAHHVVVDGWGFFNWARALVETLDGRATCGDEYAAVLQQVLADEQAYAASRRRDKDLDYWRLRFRPPPLPSLAPKYPGGSVIGARSRRCVRPLPARARERIAFAARHASVSEPAVCLALFALHFMRYLDVGRVNVGMPFHCRNGEAQRRAIAQFVRELPLQITDDGVTTLAGFAAHVERELRAVYRHRRLAPTDVHACARSAGHVGRLFDLRFNYIDTAASLGEVGAGAALHSVGNGDEPTPLTLTMFENAGAFRLEFDYRTDHFTGAEVERIAERLLSLIERLPLILPLPLAAIDILTVDEARYLVSDAPAPAACTLSVNAAIARGFAEHPERVAVVHGDQRYTYRDLERRAQRLQSAFVAHGIGRGAKVGVHLARTVDLVATLIALLRLGACYVPLDPKYPGERCRWIAANSGAAPVIVDTASTSPSFEGVILALDALDAAAPVDASSLIEPDDDELFYLVYTSGSTGRPKGVRVRQGGVSALIAWARATYDDDELAVVLAGTSINFDLSVFELFVPLCCGTTLHLVDDVLSLVSAPAPVSLINTVPSVVAGLLDAGAIGTSVRVVNLAGEQLGAPVVRRLFAETGVRRVFNLYGPSEDTTYSTAECFTAPVDGQPPIGRPLPGKRVRLLSPNSTLVPHGSVGEIYLGGCGLADGYHDDAELTQRRFIADPLATDTRATLYRTGDLARYTDDLRLVYLGRVDDQVKVRGFRIEPGEIEAVIRHVFGTRAVAVVATGEGERRRLVACFEAASLQAVLLDAGLPDAADPAAAIRAALQPHLPSYMVPEACTAWPSLRLTPNGKIDRRALAATDLAEPATAMHPGVEPLVARLLGVATVAPSATFFGLGGNSLQALALHNRLRQELGADVDLGLILANPTIAELAGHVARAQGAALAAEPARAADAPDHPVSPAQAALWVFDAVSDSGTGYNVPVNLEIEGDFSATAFARALAGIVDRHEALRMRYRMRDDALRQQPVPVPDDLISLVDLTQAGEAEREARATAVRQETATHRFDLARGNVVVARIVRLAPQRHRVHLCFHHIAFDGWSATIFRRELEHGYVQHLQGLPDDAPAPRRYIDHAARRDDDAPAIARWVEYLRGAPSLHALPLRHRPPGEHRRGSQFVDARLAKDASDAVIAFCRGSDMTPFAFFQAAFACLVCRVTGSDEVVIGSPAAGREQAAFESTIGLFVNPVAFRYRCGSTGGLPAFLAANRASQTFARVHQATPFRRIVERLRVRRDGLAHPVFQLWFVYDDFLPLALELPGAHVSVNESTELIDAKFDLNLYVAPTDTGFRLRWTHADDAFETGYVDRLSNAYIDLLRTAFSPLAAQADVTDGEAVVTSDLPAPPPTDIADALRAAFVHHADRVALRTDRVTWTYAELEAAARGVASLLEAHTGGRVLLLAAHDETTAAVVLGAVLAGVTYIPVDPLLPPARIARILADSGARVIAASGSVLPLASHLADDAGGCTVIDIGRAPADAPAPPCAAVADAYVLYTSGSTGDPKGIAQTRENVHFYADAYASALEFRPGDTLLMTARFATDAAVMDFYGALLSGATLQLHDLRALLDPLEGLCTRPVSVFHFTPSVFRAVFSRAPDAAFHGKVVLGGERIDEAAWQVFRRVFDAQSELVGLYGASEASFSFLQRDMRSETLAELGRIVPGLSARLVREDGTTAQRMEQGELVIAGMPLRPNYLDDAQNRRRYEGSAATGYAYRTGDQCRMSAAGEIEFIGRTDFQVKILGNRVEPEEIDAVLRRSGICRDAVTLVRPVPGKPPQLHCFAVPHDAAAPASESRAAMLDVLRATLPHYMVPHQFTLLAALPRTVSGKIDRQCLLTTGTGDEDAATGPVAPRNDLERSLLSLWCEVLAIDDAGVTDEFFASGGDSLTLIQLIGRAGGRYDVALPPKYFFGQLSVERLAQTLECARHYRAGPGVAEADEVEI